MDDEKLNKPMSRKSSSSENGKGKDIVDNGDGGEVTLKAKMSLVNGITVIVGSIIGKKNSLANHENR
jgi:solute carrier family 7 (L-type amino acid transporter), member 8